MITKRTQSTGYAPFLITALTPRKSVTIQNFSPNPLFIAIDGITQTGVTSITGANPGYRLAQYEAWSNEQSFQTDWLQSGPIYGWFEGTGICVCHEK